jgi:hypothetical protein
VVAPTTRESLYLNSADGSNDGTYTFSFKATDADGNATTVTKTIELDTKDPAVISTGIQHLQRDGVVDKSSAQASFTASEPATFECQLQGPGRSSEWEDCTNPLFYENLPLDSIP